MEAKLTSTHPNQATLKIRVPSADVRTRVNSYYSQLANRAKIPGFREGKAPLHIVKQHYAEGAQSDLSERLIAEFLWKTIEDQKIDVVLPPVLVATDKVDENSDFNFEVAVDLRPKIPQISLENLVIEVEAPREINDAEIEARLKSLQESEATFEDLSEAREAREGDYVTISFKGSFQGESPQELCADSQSLVLGDGQFLPDFEKGIPGMKVGDTKTIQVSFPEDYHSEKYRGQVVPFEITLKQIKEKKLPPLDDEVAKSSNYKAETLEELKALLRDELKEMIKDQHEKKVRDALGGLLVKNHSFDVSPRQLEVMTERLFEQTHRMMHEMGMAHGHDEKTLNEIRQSSAAKAERDLKLAYILEAIAREQKFEVTPEDIEKRYKETSEKTGLSVTQIANYYAQKDDETHRSRLENLKIDILDEKSLDYALSKATIKLKGQTKNESDPQ